jgi:hypothetical protein
MILRDGLDQRELKRKSSLLHVNFQPCLFGRFRLKRFHFLYPYSPLCDFHCGNCAFNLTVNRKFFDSAARLGDLSHLSVDLGAEACRRADRGARCAVVQCLTCLSPWVQKPAGEQTGARVVQWCSVSPACRLGCRSLPESRQEQEVCSGALVQCLTCLSPWVQKPSGEQTGA